MDHNFYVVCVGQNFLHGSIFLRGSNFFVGSKFLCEWFFWVWLGARSKDGGGVS